MALVYEYDRDHEQTLPNGFGLRAQLELLDHGELVDLLMELAESDRDFRRRLRASIES